MRHTRQGSTPVLARSFSHFGSPASLIVDVWYTGNNYSLTRLLSTVVRKRTHLVVDSIARSSERGSSQL